MQDRLLILSFFKINIPDLKSNERQFGEAAEIMGACFVGEKLAEGCLRFLLPLPK